MHTLYPRLLAVHDLDDQIALPQIDTADTLDKGEKNPSPYPEKIQMPSLMRNSYFFMEAGGIYMIGMSCPFTLQCVLICCWWRP